MDRRPRLHAVLAGLIAAAALLPAVAAGGSTDDNRAGATAEVDALLAAAALPSEVIALEGEPEGDSGLLANPPLGSNLNSVIRTAFSAPR